MKRQKYLDLAWELKSYGTLSDWLAWNGLQDLVRRIEELEIRGRAETGQNTETIPGDLRRLSVIQAPLKDYKLTLVWKTRKE